MDNLKLKTIEYFAAKPHDDPKASVFLKSQYKGVQTILASSISYESLSSALELLDKFISHVATDAIMDLVSCWERLHSSSIELEQNTEHFSKYRNKESLCSAIIQLLGRLRYIEQDRVVPILFSFWKADKAQHNKIQHVIKEIAEFNLYAFETIGLEPQIKLLAFIRQLNEREKINLFPLIIESLSNFLATDIEGHRWEYQHVVMQAMPIPNTTELKSLRKNTISTLFQIFQLTNNTQQKKELVQAMHKACRTWNRHPLSEEIKQFIEENTIEVLEFWAKQISSESMELIQKLEHDAYWIFYHASNDAVKESALTVKAAIDRCDEYQIYRDLVGFEGIFGDWEKGENYREVVKNHRNIRHTRIDKHISNINEENLCKWIDRIESYLQTDSNDLATFPELYRFTEIVTKKYPSQVLNELKKRDRLKQIAVPIFKGIWASTINTSFIQQLKEWIGQSLYLSEIASTISLVNNPKFDLLDVLLDKLILQNEINGLNRFLRLFGKSALSLSNEEVCQLFQKAFTYLNNKQNCTWTYHFWSDDTKETPLKLLTEANQKLVIENLALVDTLNYQIESILTQVVQDNITDILYFFEQRLALKELRLKSPSENYYETIPHSLSMINKPLSQDPKKLIQFIKRHQDSFSGLKKTGVISLFKKCFSPYESKLNKVIFDNLNPLDKGDFKLILDIASCYEGNSAILPLIRDLLINSKFDSHNDERFAMILRALTSTGVTRGNYGFVDAYQNKLENIQEWLNDTNSSVVKFAYKYKEYLEQRIEEEIKRIEEQITLEKHSYGVGD
ncbi:hypothetical protein D5R81_12735 [Parashewanella spongiae]|uniref:Uncharacterized protein n=1 Tax=Parashewanella spongiae TaxID=342950 RepID=A0A3A6TT51_9GAMM|nr:hypothetical protein [Parashewanella spongiae]MCL1078804.1 hypothetical protein [Parashewanella spongiae]RJY11942.1 hypothetical protein D5R81_12735 [Parashewanella spongiae]